MATSNPILLLLLLVLLFLLSFMLLADEATAESMIMMNSSISPKSANHQSSWLSSSGHFAFGFYPQVDDDSGSGYAVGIWLIESSNATTIVWTANRDDPPLSSNSTLQLTENGLILRTGEEGTEQFIVQVSTPTPTAALAASASMLDSGNFVIYGGEANDNKSTWRVVWQSFDFPTDTILGGQNLTHEKQLVSSMSKSDHGSGRFYLIMQTDNNLVAYTMNSSGQAEDAYWDSYHTHQFGPAGFMQLQLSLEGFLCIGEFQCLANNTNFRNKLQNSTSIFRATLDFDGNFKLYEHQFVGAEGNASSSVQMLWEALLDECQIKGFCGFNSYCSNTTRKAVCACYPGFIPSQFSDNNMFLECKLNYSRDECITSTEAVMLYDVVYMEDMWLGEFPYLVQPMAIESCERSCKKDCDCAAALYSSGQCNKYKLPLRYGRRVQNISSTALFKVPSSSRNVNAISPNHTILPPLKPKVIVDNRKSLIMVLAFTLGSISLISLVFAVYIFFTYRRQVHSYTMLSGSSNMGFKEECSLRSFSFDELVKATGGFKEEIGRGSFGAVYRGAISDSNRSIAVKRLERIVDEGEREFRAEITAIARTHHKNLVKLIGYCIDGSRKLLVYEYVSNGSLANLLFKAKKHLPLKEKLKIALDVARGVQYLHEECQVCIIHCNLKPQNILMDEEWNAKISDFGFARLLKPEGNDDDDVRSGYLAPEWQKDTSLLSIKSDIYSYGVILLEIVCRRRSIEVDVSSPEEILISSWVYQCFVTSQLNKLVANDEEEDADLKTLERMVKVGLWCVQDDPSMRPSMKNVILMLEGWKDIPVPECPPL